MADPHAAVADTHALLFHFGGGRKLGPKAAALFADAEENRAVVYVPMGVLMELTFLAKVRRGGLRVSASAFFNTVFLNPAFQPFDLSLEQILAAEELRFNRDPYDALIVAAAQVLGLPLITRDMEIVASKAVKVIW